MQGTRQESTDYDQGSIKQYKIVLGDPVSISNPYPGDANGSNDKSLYTGSKFIQCIAFKHVVKLLLVAKMAEVNRYCNRRIISLDTCTCQSMN